LRGHRGCTVELNGLKLEIMEKNRRVCLAESGVWERARIIVEIEQEV
jgi:hypothetical protein